MATTEPCLFKSPSVAQSLISTAQARLIFACQQDVSIEACSEDKWAVFLYLILGRIMVIA